MIGKSDRASAEFLAWESRGRGHEVWEGPVEPEPRFAPFAARERVDVAEDDGRKATFLSSLVRRLSERLSPPSLAAEEVQEDRGEASPRPLERGELMELRASLPDTLRLDLAAYVEFLGSLRTLREPLSFELVATAERIVAQFAAHPADERALRRLLATFLPDVKFTSGDGYLAREWSREGGAHAAALEFGLGKELAVPFAHTRGEPFVGLAGALSDLAEGEVAVFQVIFAQASRPWAESIVRSVSHADGSAYFVNAPELLSGARQKVELPLFAAVVRLAARTSDRDRTWDVIRDAAVSLGAYDSAKGNMLVPLANDGYPADAHEADVALRQSRRSGMLLNAAELAGFVHLPSSDARSPKLRPRTRKTKAAPPAARNPGGLELGINSHDGEERVAALSRDQRSRHVHVIGASGTGKSTLLYRMIMQDIRGGEGVTVLDPHGDLVDRLLGSIPEDRVGDVIVLDPSDEERIVGFNILSAESDWERNMLASDLVSVFRRLSTSWGDQLNSVLHNAILAILKSSRGGTLLELRRFLLEPRYRAEFLATVSDPNLLYYWNKAFPQLSGNKSVGSVITRLDAFLSPESIRYMVAQRESRLDVRDVMDSGKILLAKLSQGAVGKDNSHLLGSLLVAKLQSQAMARQRQAEADRRYHWAYVDEFHDFLTPSMADSLTGVRKYRLGLVLAHQEMRQVEREPEVASALLANAYTRVVFRVGDRDARTMESGFAGFEARDIQSLATGEAICRIERVDQDFSLSVPQAEPVDAGEAERRREAVLAASRGRYGVPRAQMEEAIRASMEPDDAQPVPAAKARRKPEPEEPVERPAPQPEAAPVQERQPVAGPAPAPKRPAAPKLEAQAAQPTAPGVGGVQHKTVQSRVRAAAESLGFLVEVEKEVLGGAGQIDLALSRGGLSIACEVTVTTTVDHEVGNVAKCAQAGFMRIAVVGLSARKLADIEEAVARSLGAGVAALVGYYLPDAFIEHLGALPPPEPAEPEVKTVKGYKVKTTAPKLTPEEAKAKEEAALRLIADAMRRRPKKG